MPQSRAFAAGVQQLETLRQLLRDRAAEAGGVRTDPASLQGTTFKAGDVVRDPVTGRLGHVIGSAFRAFTVRTAGQ